MKELKQIIHAFELACEKQQKAALATVVHVEGSSYRGPGARMLITEDGMLTGAISGGCLEGDALRKALMVMMQGKPLLATYDTSGEDDAVIGAGLGCNGIIRVLIEPVIPEDAANPVALLQQVLQKRQASVLVTFFSLQDKWSTAQGTCLLLKGDGEVLRAGAMLAASDAAAKEEATGTLPGAHAATGGRATTKLPDAHPGTEEKLPTLPDAPTTAEATLPDTHTVIKDAEKIFEKKEATFIQYQHKGAPVSAFYEYIAPPLSLVVAGAGNDVFPLVQISEVLGWEVTLVDGRPNYANARRFPDCRLIVSNPENALQHLALDERTAVVLMTHNYNYDKAMLKALAALPVNYIGMLGPRKKFTRMLAELEEEGTQLTNEQIQRIYSPTGLDIGAETAEEIALSVTAEIKAVFAGKTGASLRTLMGRLHERSTEIVASSTQSGHDLDRRSTEIVASSTQSGHDLDQLSTKIVASSTQPSHDLDRRSSEIAASPAHHSYGVVILAAGDSSRMGRPKQLLQYQGDSLLNNAIKTAAQINAAATVVVLGAEAEALKNELKGTQAAVVLNPQFSEGMASSIRCGVQYMMDHENKIDHIILMVCDQPHVTAAHLLALTEQHRATGAGIVASLYAGRKGVPALFDRSVFPELLALTGDVGARHIIEKQDADVTAVPFPLGTVDIDTEEAYRALVATPSQASL